MTTLDEIRTRETKRLAQLNIFLSVQRDLAVHEIPFEANMLLSETGGEATITIDLEVIDAIDESNVKKIAREAIEKGGRGKPTVKVSHPFVEVKFQW